MVNIYILSRETRLTYCNKLRMNVHKIQLVKNDNISRYESWNNIVDKNW